jgi:membrane protein
MSRPKILGLVWTTLKSAGVGYVEDNCLSRGAAIAYYTTFSLAPVLLIVIAVAGLAFGDDAARGAVVRQIGGLMGQQGADAIQAMIKGAANRHAGILATVIGGVTLLVAASGVFSEMQTALNVIWKAKPRAGAVMQLVRARLQSLGLVLILGFLLAVSLVASAALTAAGAWLSARLPGVHAMLVVASMLVSFLLITALFAAIYKMLPDTTIAWRDVGVGAAVTALLFNLGKNLIGLYVGSSSIASTYGAAGALGIILVWIYYSSQIFLFGAEFTRAYAEQTGSRVGQPVAGSGHAQEIEHLKAKLGAASRPVRGSARA